MIVAQPLLPVSHQGADIAVAQARSDAFRAAQCRVSRSSFDGAQVTVVWGEDVHHALTVLAVIDRRNDQAVPEHLSLVRHPCSLSSAPNDPAIPADHRHVTKVSGTDRDTARITLATVKPPRDLRTKVPAVAEFKERTNG